MSGKRSDGEYYPPNCNDAEQFLCSQFSILKTNVHCKAAQHDNDSFQVALLFDNVLTRAPLVDMANCYKDYLQKQKMAEEELLQPDLVLLTIKNGIILCHIRFRL